jgi:ATP-dependent protease ClpP protease subunit
MPNEIKLYGVIGEDVMAKDVKNAIDAMDQTQPLVVRIHSEGGAVNEGLAIYDAIKAYAGPKRAVIESAAFSIASHIAMAFDDVEITENGYLMIHNPHMEVGGDDVAHAQAAEVLAKLKESMVAAYSSKTGKPREEVLAVMANETWINAREALAGGYVSRIMPPKLKAVAKMKTLPKAVADSLGCETAEPPQSTGDKPMSSEPVAATIEEIEAKFPTMKADRVLACIKRKLPMASVMTEALGAMEEEMMGLRAKLAQYETEASAKAMETEEETLAKAKAMEEEEMLAKAKAKSGVKPLAKATTSGKPSAKAQWESLVAEQVKAGVSKPKAVMALVRSHSDIHQAMLAEVNS